MCIRDSPIRVRGESRLLRLFYVDYALPEILDCDTEGVTFSHYRQPDDTSGNTVTVEHSVGYGLDVYKRQRTYRERIRCQLHA